MRLTNSLNAQHLGWIFKKIWHIKGKRIVPDTGAEAQLKKMGIPVVDSLELVSDKPKFEKVNIVGYFPLKVLEDETHPNWHPEICYCYQDSNVLVEGVPQAQILTKTVEIKSFPKNVEERLDKMKITSSNDKIVQNAIKAAQLFDAEQEKTAIIKVPERPAFVFPRNYGITDTRKNRLIISKLLLECENLAGRSVTSQRKIVNDAAIMASLVKNGDRLQFNLTADTLMTSKRPIEPVKGKYEQPLPEIFPLKHTISIPEKNIYVFKSCYPLPQTSGFANPHTIFVHYSPAEVRNLHETTVTKNQFEARSMVKAFATAAARAKQLYGDDVKQLQQPVVVQCVQTDGKAFHFGVFQLNTLDLCSVEGPKNYWFHLPTVNLFEVCMYDAGRPVLTGYNKDVFRYVNAFYRNC